MLKKAAWCPVYRLRFSCKLTAGEGDTSWGTKRDQKLDWATAVSGTAVCAWASNVLSPRTGNARWGWRSSLVDGGEGHHRGEARAATAWLRTMVKSNVAAMLIRSAGQHWVGDPESARWFVSSVPPQQQWPSPLVHHEPLMIGTMNPLNWCFTVLIDLPAQQRCPSEQNRGGDHVPLMVAMMSPLTCGFVRHPDQQPPDQGRWRSSQISRFSSN